MAEFFGFEIKRKGNKKDDFENKGKSFVPPADESGGVITVGWLNNIADVKLSSSL